MPILLEKVDLMAFEAVLFKFYEVKLSADEKVWFSGDGKELRGSIVHGETRGFSVVQLVRHDDRAVLWQGFYDGMKESEKPALRQVLWQSGGIAHKITADALHLAPKTTELIANSGGVFLIGLKANQKRLLEEMKENAAFLTPIGQSISLDKGHGRIEKQSYFHYDIGRGYYDERWDKSDFRSLFKVIRERYDLLGTESNSETAYYLSNEAYDGKGYFFGAIRSHWSVEVNNHVRDVTLKEDSLKTKKGIKNSRRESEHL
ncbi:MAG: putative transposase YbfD/YdcC [Spirosomataceae bacterium]